MSTYGQHVVVASADGTAAMEYEVRVVPGRCDHENPCFIVGGDSIGPSANYTAIRAGATGRRMRPPRPRR